VSDGGDRMSDTAIRATALGKRYDVGRTLDPHRTLREALMESVGGMIDSIRPGRKRDDTPPFWALRDVSFEIARGQAVGLIGGNGAGKSTLLKVLSRVTTPTTGRGEIHGRVGSLLEVGTGFHPDLTGRENVFLNGAILGMRRAEIVARFDEIVGFAEVERFIDTPVKRYSSGMYLRLAFAVAAHLEPEVLLVDEVLAVGDAAFQRKCLGKMGDVASSGRTVLFVSHNMAAVQSLCERALWLRGGQVVEDGPTNAVVSRYLSEAQTTRTMREWPELSSAPGNDRVRMRRAAVAWPPTRGGAEETNEITTRTPLRLEFEYWNLREGARLNLSLHVYDQQGVMAFNTLPPVGSAWRGKPFPVGRFRDVCHIPADLLNDGRYRIELLVVQDETTVVYRDDDILTFEVRDSADLRGGWYGRWPGVVRPLLAWDTQLVESGAPDAG
jgi:lipopolysaccharide transport system ATP-binding protein